MDNGIFPGNYYDYPDDEVAIQREFEIADNCEGQYKDEEFPANARSLYFDPLNPPKGAIPNESIKWFSIAQGDVVDCNFPEFFRNDGASCLVQQGALGNSYFVNALRILSCQPKYITRLLVSDKFATQGLYTLKFCKAGKWRYVHIDDRIPCRQSGTVNFARNFNPNETFAMLLEKAYAKLHGCYEAIGCGMIDKVIQDLTASAAVQCLRVERYRSHQVCDEVWDLLERGIVNNQLIGCGRFIQDPYGENPAKRKGITLGYLYQVIDVVISSAEPTEDLDAITVGMVCVRNLQHNAGRYSGRWSYGHKIWSQYKEIAFDLRHRTREIQHKRGLGANPNDGNDAQFDEKGNKVKLFADDTDDTEPDEENDDVDIASHEKRQVVKMVQPQAEDLHWIQIEDFVDVFNRVFITTDHTFEKEGAVRRYVSRWVPGDFVGGSGGPPIIVTAQTEGTAADKPADNKSPEQTAGKGQASRPTSGAASRPQSGIKGLNTTGAAGGAGAGNAGAGTEVPKVIERYAMINDSFTDNPMYPFSVTEPTTLGVALYQKDRRWNMGRLGDNPRDVLTKQFSSRGERLRACLEYPVGVGYLVVKLSGLKHRLTEFKLKKIVSGSENVVFSNVSNNLVYLFPGRYAIIPFTHTRLSRSQEYVLHINFLSHQVEFEIEDVLEQRLVDDAPSDEDSDYEAQPDDNDLLHLHEDDDDVSIMSYEKVKVPTGEDGEEDSLELEESEEDSLAEEKAKFRNKDKVPPPRLLLYKPWEYAEDSEELGVQQVFGEVGDIMKYVKTLRGEVRKLHATIRAVQAAEARNAANAAAEADSNNNVAQGTNTQPGTTPGTSNGIPAGPSKAAPAKANPAGGAQPGAGGPQQMAESKNLLNTSKRY